MLVADFAADFRAEAAIDVRDLVGERNGLLLGDRVLRILKDDVVERALVRRIVAAARAIARRVFVIRGAGEQPG